MYSDVERLLVGWLGERFDHRVVTDVPADLVSVLPLIQVTRIAGSDATPTLDVALVDIDVYASGRAAAFALAENLRAAVRFGLPGQIVSGALIPRVVTQVGPAWRPYDNSNVRRVGASYEVTVQSQGAWL